MRLITAVIFLLYTHTTFAQSPVHWNYIAKKISDKVYEVHLRATVDAPWHIYSQHIGEGGPMPTSISFSKNPIIIVNKNVKEIGDVIKKREEVFNMDVQYFNSKVDFVQDIELKASVKTNLNGTIKYMACNESECLPPKTINFTVAIN